MFMVNILYLALILANKHGYEQEFGQIKGELTPKLYTNLNSHYRNH